MNRAIEEAREKRKNQSMASHQHEKNGMDLAKEDVREMSAKLLQTMAIMFSGEKITSVLDEALKATRSAKVTDADGKTKVIEVPDHKIRIDANRLILSYTVGMPVQREEKVNYNFDMNDLNPAQLIEQLASSPAMLTKVEEMVKEARARSKTV